LNQPWQLTLSPFIACLLSYLAGQPANPFSHSLHEDTNYDFRQLHERTLIEGIMKEARRDVEERIWEGSILKARRELKVPGL
jgi:hypothetical protein